jgi:RNA polymerase sigma factor (sigma-70 family)
MDDHQLLEDFQLNRSQDAFRRLMERHLPMVYSAACRMTPDFSLAQDITQNVFLMLTRKAGSIRPPQVVGGWLYNTTRHIAMHTIRGEQRRRQREEEAAARQRIQADSRPDPILADLEPAMEELDSSDRDALVLRYFENRSLREVGTELGVSEDAARMRVNRAEERLRAVFNRRGLAVTSTALLAALGLTTGAAVPAGLATTITAAVFGAAATTTIAITTMNWINIKSIGAIVAAVALTGGGTYLVQHRQIEQIQRAQQSLIDTNQVLLAQLDSARKAAQASEDQLKDVRRNNDELLRLRSEVGQLRRQVAGVKAARPAVQSSPSAPASQQSQTYQYARERLANLGYDTPETALVTAAWAAIQGDKETILATLSQELLTNKQATAIYNRNQKAMGSLLKQITMLSRKTVSDTEVQIKMEYDLDNGNGTAFKQYAITPMMKGAAGWKLGITRDYSQNWEQDGTIEPLGASGASRGN